MKKLYLLDRNAVGVIKLSLEKKVPNNHEIHKQISKLKSLDKKGNTISPILAIIEGSSCGQGSTQEKKETLDRESNLVSTYYKKAQTDTQALQAIRDSFCTDVTGTHEHSFQSAKNFLREISNMIHQQVSHKKKETVKNNIISSAIKNKLIVTHPVVLCALATLYGCKDARKILKPTPVMQEAQLYNALSDLFVISRLIMIHSVQKEQRSFNINFITFDKGLKFFCNALTINNVSYSNNNRVCVTQGNLTINPKLFPDLSINECRDLISSLEKKAKGQNIIQQALMG